MRRFALLCLAYLCMGQATGTGVGVPFHSAWRGGGGPLPVFQFDPENTVLGVAGLSRTLTINGTSVSPAIWCTADNADADSLNCTDESGDTYELALTGTGNAPTLNTGSPTLGAADDGLTFAGAKYYQEATAGQADLTTQDLVVEYTGTLAGSGAPGLMGNQDQTSPFPGWMLFETGGKVRLQIDTGPASASIDSPSVTAGAHHHVFGCINRNEASANGAQVYLNGADDGTGVDASGAAATITSTKKFTVGAFEDASGKGSNKAIQLAVWKQADLLSAGATGLTECATAAADRFAIISGTKAKRGVDKVPTFTRAGDAFLNKGGTLYSVGNNWPRVEDTGTAGFLVEAAVENAHIQSEDLGTSHTVIQAGDATGGSVTAPDGSTSTTSAIIGDATDGEHGFTQNVTLTAVSWTMSAYFKSGDQTFAYLSDDTVATADAYVDLSDCTAGTVGAAATLHLDSTVTGWCRAGITFTGTAAAHTLSWQCAAADTDNTYAGDTSTTNCSVWGRQAEIGVAPSSYVATTTTAVTRAGDAGLDYDVPTGITAGTIVCTASSVNAAGAASGGRVFSLREDNSNYIDVLAQSSGKGYWWISNAGGSTVVNEQAATPQIRDGSAHTIASQFLEDNYALFIDNTSAATDTSAAVAAYGNIHIGIDAASSAGTQWGGAVHECRLYATPGVTQ